MDPKIDRLAARAAADPFFLGSALALYAQSEHLDSGGLASVLGCPVETLSLLSLCRRPAGDSPRFRDDVETIAARFALQPEVLADMIRRADAVTVLRAEPGSPHGALAAARDRNEHVDGDPGGADSAP